MTSFGENLSRAIRESGLTKVEIAKKLNTTTTTIYRWEKGINEASDEAKKSLAKILGVSVAYLIGEVEKKTARNILQPMREEVGLSIEEAAKLIDLPPEDLEMMEENEHLADDVLKQKLIKAYGKYLSHRDGENGVSEKGKSEEDLETLLKMLAAEDPDLVLQFRHVAKNIDKIHPKDKEFLATLFKAALGKIELEDHTDEY